MAWFFNCASRYVSLIFYSSVIIAILLQSIFAGSLSVIVLLPLIFASSL